MFNNKKPGIMKNVLQKTVSILICSALALLYTYVKTDKTDKKEVYDRKPKEVNILKESYSYASERDKELAEEFKIGFIKECKKLEKKTPIRVDDSFILKKIDITDKLITYSYQFEFNKSEISEEEWKDFIELSKKEIKREMLSNAKESLPKVKISLSRILELADISLEYIYNDINGSIVGTIHLDYMDFYGM